MSNHARQFSIVEATQKGTEETDVSLFDRLRDALGGYTAHARLEVTRIGREILDKATVLHVAVRRGYARRSSTEWSDASGFRSPGDYRKAQCGEHPFNLTDLAVLRVLDLEGFRGVVDDLAREAGGRFELLQGDATPIAQTIARLGTCTADLNSAFLMALSPEGAGGTAITELEAEAFRTKLVEIQRAVAEAAAALAAMEASR